MLALFAGSYLVGSIPVGYLIVRKKAEVNILASGSGRAGGFNAFFVTKSRFVGIFVGCLDALKGLIAVLVAGILFPQSFLIPCGALIGAIAGHNYPVWTRFKGGRGLATAAGGMFILGFSFTIVWCVIWLVTKLVLKREILISNLTAIITTPMVIWILPWEWVDRLVVAKVEQWAFTFFACVLSIILLLGHLDVVKVVWQGSPPDRTNVNSTHEDVPLRQ